MSRNCSTWRRSLLLSFSTCCLGILGLEGAINCILARTSHQRTTSEKRSKALLPKCPLFGGSTVYPTEFHDEIKWRSLYSCCTATVILCFLAITLSSCELLHGQWTRHQECLSDRTVFGTCQLQLLPRPCCYYARWLQTHAEHSTHLCSLMSCAIALLIMQWCAKRNGNNTQ